MLVRPFLAIACITAICNSTPCRADTDYLCLNQCVSTGSSTPSCLNNCSYNVKADNQYDAMHVPTDHQCLSQCVNNGKPTSTCLNDCAHYLKTDKPDVKPLPEQDKDFKNNHHVFSAPVPVEKDALIPVKKADKATTEIDWTCMSACLQPSAIYSMCEKQCTHDLDQSAAQGKQ